VGTTYYIQQLRFLSLPPLFRELLASLLDPLPTQLCLEGCLHPKFREKYETRGKESALTRLSQSVLKHGSSDVKICLFLWAKIYTYEVLVCGQHGHQYSRRFFPRSNQPYTYAVKQSMMIVQRSQSPRKCPRGVACQSGWVHTRYSASVWDPLRPIRCQSHHESHLMYFITRPI